jgi:hypothetical protein
MRYGDVGVNDKTFLNPECCLPAAANGRAIVGGHASVSVAHVAKRQPEDREYPCPRLSNLLKTL